MKNKPSELKQQDLSKIKQTQFVDLEDLIHKLKQSLTGKIRNNESMISAYLLLAEEIKELKSKL